MEALWSNTNQCHDCHGKPEQTLLLGPRTRQLDRDFDFGAGPENQLDHMAALGLPGAAQLVCRRACARWLATAVRGGAYESPILG
jgi:hypothetical protein